MSTIFSYYGTATVAPLNPLNFNAYYISKLSDGYVNGKTAASFDDANSEYLSSASTDFDVGDEDFSWGGWVYVDSTMTSNGRHYFNKNGAAGTKSYTLAYNGGNGKLQAAISTDGTNFTWIVNGLASAKSTWHHVMAVYDSAANLIKITVNGAAFVTAAHTGGAFASTADLVLGTYTPSPTANGLTGRMDASVFYTKALSQAQSDALYNSGTGVAYEDYTADMLTSLVSHWDLNELSGDRFDSHGTNTLTDYNTVGSALGHVVSDAYSGGYVAKFTTANSEFLSSTSIDFDKGDEDFSFGCWFNTTNAALNQGIISKYIDPSNRSYLMWLSNTNVLYVMISSDGGAGGQTSFSSVTISTNRWYFLSYVYDSAANLLKLSVDGAAFTTAAHTGGAYASSTADFIIGDYNYSGTHYYFDGQIDGTFFYDKALSQAQVTALYNSRLHLKYADLTADMLTSLVSYYELDEESGNRADSHGTNTLTDNNTVTSALYRQENVFQVLDGSGNSISMEQSTFGAQPLYIDEYLLFDGVDDVLTNSTANVFSGDSSGYVFFAGIWQGQAEYFLSSADTATSNYMILFGTTSSGKVRVYQKNNDTPDDIQTTTVLISGAFYYGYIKSDGTSYEINLNGVVETLITNSGSNSGDYFADTPNRDNLTVGALIRDASFFKPSKIKAVWVTSEADGDANSALYLTDLAALET